MNSIESLGAGSIVTGIGMLVVFICLAILIIIMILLPKYIRKIVKNNSVPQKEKQGKATDTKPAAQLSITDESELIAVLTAAVACMLQTSSSKLVIKSYKRVASSAWKKAGLDSQILNNF